MPHCSLAYQFLPSRKGSVICSCFDRGKSCEGKIGLDAFAKKSNWLIRFDLLFRKNPFRGEYTIFAGLGECIKFTSDFHFEKSHIEYLRSILPPTCEVCVWSKKSGFYHHSRECVSNSRYLAFICESEGCVLWISGNVGLFRCRNICNTWRISCIPKDSTNPCGRSSTSECFRITISSPFLLKFWRYGPCNPVAINSQLLFSGWSIGSY
jgi:hypothetical protein